MFYGITLAKLIKFLAENLRVCDFYCTFVRIFSTLLRRYERTTTKPDSHQDVATEGL